MAGIVITKLNNAKIHVVHRHCICKPEGGKDFWPEFVGAVVIFVILQLNYERTANASKRLDWTLILASVSES